MIKSMTGFGRSETINADYKLIIEMKAVNHRYSEYTIKLPKKLNAFESNIRTVLKEYIERGKVDVFILYEDFRESSVVVKYNADIAKEYVDYLAKMNEDFGIENDVTTTKLAALPDVFTKEEQPIDEEALWELVEEGLRKAAEAFSASRAKEGENLRLDLIQKLEGMVTAVDTIEEKSTGIASDYRSKLEEKVKELLGDHTIDEARIAQEVIIYADKICVDEETVRLKSHIKNAIDILNQGGSVGRKLDFIAQEMNREANTILSKANSLEISNIAIDLKTTIEKVREQIQNLE